MSTGADLIIINGDVWTLAPERPRATAVAVRAGRIVGVGGASEIAHRTAGAEVLDARGGLVVPGFHDAHLHLLSFARAVEHIDGSGLPDPAALQNLLTAHASRVPRGQWLRVVGFDGDAVHRFALDAAAPAHPVRVQHRTLHLDILNTLALRLTGLFDQPGAEIERDADTGEPTGRLFHAGPLLFGRLPRPSDTDLAASVRQACARLHAWGVTSVHDATVTNDEATWELLHELARRGDLTLRVTVMTGTPRLATGTRCSALVRPGPVKIVLDEATSNVAEIRDGIAAAHAAGRPVAIHAISEAEVAIAIDGLREVGVKRDRIEHGALIPDALVSDLASLGVTVVGQPALVAQRGDEYLATHPVEQRAWLHRAGSLLRAGIRYAASSDAPLTEPSPVLGMAAARGRRARSGQILGPAEALRAEEALAAYTRWPAEIVGTDQELGHLSIGARADIVVLDPDAVVLADPSPRQKQARATIFDGKVVWRRPD